MLVRYVTEVVKDGRREYLYGQYESTVTCRGKNYSVECESLDDVVRCHGMLARFLYLVSRRFRLRMFSNYMERARQHADMFRLTQTKLSFLARHNTWKNNGFAGPYPFMESCSENG